MYYKINTTGCAERGGLVQVRYDCFLSRDDAGNEEHYVPVPDFTDAKYEGKVDESGLPEDMEDYQKWVASLPMIFQNNPFCCHFRYFDSDVTDDEIIKSGDQVLTMAHENFQKGALHQNTNPTTAFTTKLSKITASISRVSEIKTTNFADIAVSKGIIASKVRS
jgi:hypothetical protein